MISAEQARKNVELHNSKVAAIKRKKAEEYIEKVLEPQIVDASMQGKSDVVVDIGECMEAISEVMGMIQEAGFKTERFRNPHFLGCSRRRNSSQHQSGRNRPLILWR